MAQDNRSFSDIFDAAADAALTSRTKSTVEKILSEIAFKFDNNVFSLSVEKMATTSCLLIDTIAGQNLQVAEDGLGNFRIYENDQKISNNSTAQEAVAAIGKFFGEHSDGAPPKAPRPGTSYHPHAYDRPARQ
jgi:hypothetical protein